MRKLTWAGLTDVGRKRTGNEDAFIVDPELGLYVVCDGMGGHASGEVASAMTTEEVHTFVANRADGDRSLPYKGEPGASLGELVLSNAIQHANDKVFVAGMRDPHLEGMGTTVVAVAEYEEHLVLAHIGDSRIYRLRDGVLEQVTRDHSLLNHKIDLGELRTQEEIDAFKHGNVIVRAIGLKDYVRPETAVHERVPGDLYCLCSDGLSDMVDDWSIESVLEANRDDLEEACTILVRMANERGGKDNITVVLVRVDDEPMVEWANDTLHDSATADFPAPAVGREESTAPAQPAYEDEDDDDPQTIQSSAPAFKDFGDGGPSEERTAPHTPVFGWDDEEGEPAPVRSAPGPASAATELRRRTMETRETPRVQLDAGPNIIIDDDSY
jgi:serine/threonine protein phosphatase PrpC